MHPDITKKEKLDIKNLETVIPKDKKGLLRPVGHAIRYD
jgi:hypothetical protein